MKQIGKSSRRFDIQADNDVENPCELSRFANGQLDRNAASNPFVLRGCDLSVLQSEDAAGTGLEIRNCVAKGARERNPVGVRAGQGSAHTTQNSWSRPLMAILILLIPGHLDSLQFALARFSRFIGKIRQLGDPLVQISEPNRQRVHIRVLFDQRQRNIFSIFPLQSGHQKQCYRGDSYVFRRGSTTILLLACASGPIFAQLTAKQKAENLESFEVVWTTVRDRHPDPNLNGLNWRAIHDSTRPAIEDAQSMTEVRRILTAMVAKLETSHYAIIPGDLYNQIDSPNDGPSDSGVTPVIIGGKAVVGTVAPNSPAAEAGLRPGMVLDSINGARIDSTIQGFNALKDQESHRIVEQSITRKLDGPTGKPVAIDVIDEQGRPKHLELNPASAKGELVQFGNLPAMRVFFDSHALPDSTGYIRFNEFLDPASLMPKFEDAVNGFARAPGIILDLRGNPGGISLMAMGIAGFFIDEDGKKLGEMKMRETTLKFVIFPRAETYSGPLAILVDEGSASTSEIFAGGMQDLKRARVFGVRTAGAALPSDIVRLPNGDGFQYPQASYTSVSGKVLEGAGVTPDVIVEQTREALLAGRDLVIEAADTWIRSISAK